jgi:hypothetical protein
MNRHLLHALVAFYAGLVAAVLLDNPTRNPEARFSVAMAVVFAAIAWLTLEVIDRKRKGARGGTVDADTLRKGEPPRGGATLFIYRDPFVVRAAESAVSIDSTGYGALRAGTFFRIDLAPGEYRVLSRVAALSDAAASITLAAGGRVYLRIALQMASSAPRHQLEIVAAAAGDAALGRCRPLVPRARPAVLAHRAAGG